jgi:hypothetical protein
MSTQTKKYRNSIRGVSVGKQSGLENKIAEAALDGTKRFSAALDERKVERSEKTIILYFGF